MPIRFRCPHCNRLLGIARRKAGTDIACPQCGVSVSVPQPAGNLPLAEEMDEIDQLLGSAVLANGTSPPPAATRPAAATRPRTESAPSRLPPEPPTRPLTPPKAVARPAVEETPKEAAPPKPPPASPKAVPADPPKRKKPGDSLFETGDVDELLGLPPSRKPPVAAVDEAPTPPRPKQSGPKPMTGMDVRSLDGGDGTWVVSPQKVALLLVAVVLLLLFAFGAGFLIASLL